MKTNRYNRLSLTRFVKLAAFGLLTAAACVVASPGSSRADHSDQPSSLPKTAATPKESQAAAITFLRQMQDFIGNGPAFDAKLRETVWTSGREVVGVGTYEQSGGGSGQYNLQVTMHDGDGKHQLQQISDGKLAWTRTEIAGQVSLRRVDVGRLEEWVRGTERESELSPKLKVGAWGELLESLKRDYSLRIDTARLRMEPSGKPVPMRVLIGELKPDRRAQVLHDAERSEWPSLYPTRVHVAVSATADPETGLGQWVPARIEYWSDPIPNVGSHESSSTNRRLIALIELYSLRPITPPPPERFRFDNQDAEVNFINETDRYVESYGVNLTQGQRRQLFR